MISVNLGATYQGLNAVEALEQAVKLKRLLGYTDEEINEILERSKDTEEQKNE